MSLLYPKKQNSKAFYQELVLIQIMYKKPCYPPNTQAEYADRTWGLLVLQEYGHWYQIGR